MGKLRKFLPQVVLFSVFGLWLPWLKGTAFLDSVLLSSYACLPVIFAAPLSVSDNSVFRPVSVAVGISWAMLVSGVAVVYLTRTVVVGPDLQTVAEAALFGIALATAASAIVAFVAKKSSRGTATVVARLLLLALLVLFYFRSGWLPEVALVGAAIATGIAAIFLVLLRRA